MKKITMQMYGLFFYSPKQLSFLHFILSYFHYSLLFASTKEELKGKSLSGYQVVSIIADCCWGAHKRRTPLPEVSGRGVRVDINQM
ncbi:MAG TPA: hypothetical protein H9807_05635 [Candidatus Bacteroides merdavium]|uniref:Uncharacterized protein n=1 Tax=Candidatus Bacteroides merdavium TaxID=2838472 RepID=A0A9D2KDV3_9BACE|nr:hypothetical protein [uncultured Bacteroides sp.]HIZ91581.1 hypothetical protein [Candidatus Bacteroides merdavium]